MRLEGISKMGYYPTPAPITPLINQLITARAGANIRLLDPCAGEGEALATLAKHITNLGATTHTISIELSHERAEIAQTWDQIDLAIQADWKEISISNNSCSLLFLNPPYDHTIGNLNDGQKRIRTEYLFLRNTIRSLQPDGLLIYIVPQALLANPKVASYLSSCFTNLALARFPDPHFEAFNQVIVFGTKKAKASRDPAIAQWISQSVTENHIFPLDELINSNAIQPYTLPRQHISTEKFLLKKYALTRDEMLKALTTGKSVFHTGTWADLQPNYDTAEFHPVVPLRTGHVGSLIASGQMRTVDLGNLVAKGRAIKDTIAYDKHNNKVPIDSKYAAVIKEIFHTTVTTLDEYGDIEQIVKIRDLQAFLELYAQDIAHVIERQFWPIYSEPTTPEWHALAHLMPHKKLPGRNEAGLLPVQKHVAIAASRCAKKHGWADLIGEMGVGKTCVGLSALELLNGYPAVVLCPSHLVKKWQSEAKEVADAHARIIEKIEDLIQFKHEHDAGTLPPRAIAIISKEKAKLGPGWQHAYTKRWTTVIIKENVLQPSGIVIEQEVAKRVQAVACPHCGQIQRDKDGIPLLDLPAKRNFCNQPITKWIGDPDDHTLGESKQTPCNQPLFEFGAKFRRWPLAAYIRHQMPNFFKVLLADEFHQFKGKSSDQAQAYHNLVMATDYTLNLTGTLFGGKSTDLFWLRYRVDPDVRRDFAFNEEMRWAHKYGRLQYTLSSQEADDGKFSGQRRYQNKAKEIPGISPAIFSRLLKSCIFVRIADLGVQLPNYEEEVIRIEMADNQAHQYHWLHDSLLDRIQKLRQQAGYGGVSDEAQRLLSVWLQNSLSRPNSAFRNEMVMWKVAKGETQDALGRPMPERVPYAVSDFPIPSRYEVLGIGSEHLQLPEPGIDEEPFDNSEADQLFRDQYRQWLSFFRGNPQTYAAHRKPMALPRAIDDDMLLPKERWLIDTALTERKQHRKIILYVRQTGTRNIQPRLQRILKRYGLRATILPNGVTPARREAWIAKRTPDIDILITNPRKVETGLDLIDYHTCIFYEIEYSLFTLWQAMRRVWRLGQRKPVRVLFPIYANTLEETALELIAQKMKASLLLYGDNASSAIADESSDPAGDFLTELANRVLEDDNIELADGFSGILKNALPSTTREPIWLPPTTKPETEAVTTTVTKTKAETPTTQPTLLAA